MAKSEIIKRLANNEISMEIALNRLLIIASDLDNCELAKWAESELCGYKKNDIIPPYRKIVSRRFLYSGINNVFQVKNYPFLYLDIVLEHDPNAFNIDVKDGVHALQGFADSKNEASFGRDYSYLSGAVYEKTGVQCTRIIQTISCSDMQNILSRIKTCLLNIFLKLEKEYGCLDELDIDTSTKSSQDIRNINRIVNNYIYVDNSISLGDKNKIIDSALK